MTALLQTLAKVVTEEWFWYIVLYNVLSRKIKAK